MYEMQTKMPTAVEIAVIERRARAMRAEATAAAFAGASRWIAGRIRALRGQPAPARA